MRAAVLFSLLLLPPALAACGDPAAPPPVAALDEVDGSQRTFGMNLKLTQGGILKADLHGDTAFTRPNSEVTEIRGVDLVFFDPEGKKSGTLTSRSGEYDQRTGVMVARGSVVLVTEGQNGKGKRTIRTEELHYDQNGDRVWSTLETSMEEGGETFFTRGFTSDTRFTSVRGESGRTRGVRVNGEGL